jgi:DNA-binding response OmpR family regulator
VPRGKILVLEDDARVANAYAEALREDRNEVTVCTTFEDAREYLKQTTPDALLTDIRLGQYNGLQLALLYRATSPSGRIVVVTGHDDSVIRKEVRALHAEYLVKPVNLAQLRRLFAFPRLATH